ncbi:MAG: SixA phosphatase family protein [Steroidobacteraceae bacterium]|jgi:phosphohistidine phosphatase
MDSRRLILLRHGKAQPEGPKAGDFERPLTTRGRREAEQMGRYLVAAGLIPDLILASPATRTWSTASIVAERCGIESARIHSEIALYLASEATIWRQVTACAASVACLLICAHNPGLSQLASRLGPTPVHRELPTAGLATAVWTRSDWHHLQAETAERCELHAPPRLA